MDGKQVWLLINIFLVIIQKYYFQTDHSETPLQQIADGLEKVKEKNNFDMVH